MSGPESRTPGERPARAVKAKPPGAVVAGRAGPRQTEVIDGARVAAAAMDFCARRRLMPHLTRAIALAHRHFPRAASLDVELAFDPEDSDEYLVLRLASAGGPAIDPDCYFGYVKEWSDAMGWPASRLIRLDYNTIAPGAGP